MNQAFLGDGSVTQVATTAAFSHLTKQNTTDCDDVTTM